MEYINMGRSMGNWFKMNAPSKLKKYLPHFGKVRYIDFRITKRRLIYAGIIIRMNEGSAEMLKERLDNTISEKNGFRAKLRYIAWHEESDGKLDYSVEIVPVSELEKKFINYKSFELSHLRELYNEIAIPVLKSVAKEVESFGRMNCRNLHQKAKQG